MMSRVAYIASLIFVVSIFFVGQATASILVNGDFETNSLSGNSYNRSNSQVNLALNGITAWGTANEIDVMTSGDIYGPAPQSGSWKLGIHNQTRSSSARFDAFNFSLTQSVVAGNSYTLSFYALSELDFDPDNGPVIVGLSSTATTFGTQIFSGTPNVGSWTLLSTTFVAPVNATHLSVRNAPGYETWNHIDNFKLTANNSQVPEPTTMAVWIGLGIAAIAIAQSRRRRLVAQPAYLEDQSRRS